MVKWIRQNTTPTFMHPCCTKAMMSEEKGGVVGTDLKVHGAGGRLRVADASIFPMQVSSHLSALCYAIGEKVSFVLFLSVRVWLIDSINYSRLPISSSRNGLPPTIVHGPGSSWLSSRTNTPPSRASKTAPCSLGPATRTTTFRNTWHRKHVVY